MSTQRFWRGRPAVSGLAAVAVVSMAAMASVASAQTETQPDIVVTAASREQTQAFVSQMSIAPRSDDQLGRWDEAICIGVAGLPARQGQFIADRVAQRAFALGLEPGAPGCAPNVSIVVAPDGRTMAQQMFEQEPSLFAHRYESGISTLGQEAFDRFLNSERPVRWWHVTRTMSADGEAISNENVISGSMGFTGASTVRSNGTMLRATTRQDFSRVVIIVDGRSAGAVQLAALADYVALVALAQIDPDVEGSIYPTVLNLFNGDGRASTGLTQWDLAYLDGLYKSSRDAPSTTAQRAEIARRMAGGGNS